MAQQLKAMVALPEDQDSFSRTSQLFVIPFLRDLIPLYRHIGKKPMHIKKSFEETNYAYIYIKEYIHIYIYIKDYRGPRQGTLN